MIGRSLTPVYYLAMVLVAAPLLQRHQSAIGAWLQRLPAPGFVRFAAIGYAGVVLEETLVGTVFAVQEWSLQAWPVRVGQFVAFNVLAFTGIIVGLYVVSRTLRLGRFDPWLMAGGFGLFAEGIVLQLAAQPIAAALLILPTMTVYSVIFTPAILTVPPASQGRRVWPLPLRVVIAWLIMGAASIIPVALLMAARASHPGFFPPCAYIACT